MNDPGRRHDKNPRSAGVRALNAVCAIVFLGAAAFMFFAASKMMAASAMALALVGIAAPVIAGAEGILEVLLGIVEGVVDGLLAIVEAIGELFSGIFG